MNSAIETIEKDGIIGKIYQDEYAESPRDWDNIGKMICWHKRYTLGEEKLLELWSESKECSLKNLTDNCSGWDEVEEVLKKEFGAVVILPLFLYDHSGISMRTYPHGQHAGWDGGYVGFIFATKEDILKGWEKKKLTKSLLTKAKGCLEGEVETYSQYLEGDVYHYIVEDENGEMLDSCGGYFGFDETKKEVERVVDFYVKEHKTDLESTKALVLG